MDACPCGSLFPFTDCCGPLIRGSLFADTAEDLMRSRYTAFFHNRFNYLVNTSHPADRPLITDLENQCKNVQWKKLEIQEIEKGGREDREGKVTFVAWYNENGSEKFLHERSKFLKEDGRWYYCKNQSVVLNEKPRTVQSSKPYVRTQAKLGRNDPCFCGSGKKYKKCCGK